MSTQARFVFFKAIWNIQFIFHQEVLSNWLKTIKTKNKEQSRWNLILPSRTVQGGCTGDIAFVLLNI